MCLITENQPDIKIAQKNILCYKDLDEQNRSQGTRFRYIKGKRNRIESLIPRKDVQYFEGPRGYTGYSCFSIHEGYHSRNDSSVKEKNHLFVIPKGTQYIVGGENNLNQDNFVSETIIFTGQNNWFNRLVVKLRYGI